MLLLEVTSRSLARRCVYHVHNHQGSGALSLSASMRSSRMPFGFLAGGASGRNSQRVELRSRKSSYAYLRISSRRLAGGF